MSRTIYLFIVMDYKNDCGRHTGPVLHHRPVLFPSFGRARHQDNNKTIINNNHQLCQRVQPSFKTKNNSNFL